jgi:hypothetical protein
MIYRNLTPHAITIITEHAEITVPPEPPTPRIVDEITASGVDTIDRHQVPILQIRQLGPTDLPDPRPGIGLIVPRIIAVDQPARTDLYVPTDFVRDSSGRPIGCRALARIQP